MLTLPVASFLAGALLTILMPTLLLISIVIWSHIWVVRRTPEPPPPPRSPGAAQGQQPTGGSTASETPSSGP